MSVPIHYRRATGEDIATLCELGQILNATHHEARPDIYTAATSDFLRDKSHWLPSLHEENRAVFLAEQDSKAVGFITVQVSAPAGPSLQPMTVGRIGSIAVEENAQGQGIGSALMRLTEEWARKNGAADIRLTVWSFNAQAVRLYREPGFEIRAFEMGKPPDP